MLLLPPIERAFADAGYGHEGVTATTAIIVEIVRKLPQQVGFAVLPRRRVVERFFAWISRIKRFAKHVEATHRLRQSPYSTPRQSCCSCDGSPGH